MAEKSLFSLLNTALMRRRCEASFFLYLIIKSFLRLLPFDFGVIHHSLFLDCGTQCFIHVEGSSYTLYVIVSVPKEELWNHLQGHGGQEAVVLEGAVARIDAVVLGEAAVPAGGEFLL